MALETTAYDSADYLKTREDVVAYLEAVFEDGDPALIAHALGVIARAEGMSVLELSYAWLAGAPGVDSILLGPASVAQLDEGVAACSRGLTPEVRGLVDALYRVWMGTDASYVR